MTTDFVGRMFGAVGLIALGMVLGAVMARLAPDRRPEAAPDAEPARDTAYVHDTVTIAVPVPTDVRPVDTVRIAVRDTVRIADTVFVSLPVERKVYEDSLYRAVVSGVRPSLDSIEVYRRTSIVTIRVPAAPDRRRWGIGVQAGCGLTPHGTQPYVGIGVSYDIIRW